MKAIAGTTGEEPKTRQRKQRSRANGEGTIYQAKDGRWCGVASVGYKDGKPIRKYCYATTRATANKDMLEVLSKFKQGIPIVDDRQTVNQFLDRWLEGVERSAKLAPRTKKHYADMVRLHITPVIGRVRLAKLTLHDVERMMREASTPSNAAKARGILRIALNRGMKMGDVTRNVAVLTDAPEKERKTDKVEPLSPEETTKLLDTVRGHRLEALYIVALGLGLREGELLGLRWKDVDFDRKLLTVAQQVQRIDHVLTMTEPKSRSSHAALPMIEDVADALRAHRERQQEEITVNAHRWRDHGLVFPTSIGTPMDARNLVRNWHAALDRADIPRTRFHNLRHTCASFLYAHGARDREVMEIMRHSQISLTMNTYTHIRASALRDTANLMQGHLRGRM